MRQEKRSGVWLILPLKPLTTYDGASSTGARLQKTPQLMLERLR
ncbi:hypothetical protein HMPREF0454_00143 [Hafnia alvei ATCC 51873]|uniref:Uncharacterized protein n=1 Tax=Hafnia alvei ATCC 51873 TaxID=1002364 RepID=G9Y0T5_HAFAL|nr:hypothetical protein F652_2665 [Enterobacteriaceae bacterium bta3-1]EHM48531.1 hypothetical protein HMPREF0454_00143 [Hafnia alvei ATCC 51873]